MFVANAQSAADIRLLDKMTTTLDLDTNQVQALNSVFVSFSEQLDSLNAKIKEIQTSDVAEEQISQQSSVLFQERKDLIEWKKDQITAQLSAEQNKVYNQEIVNKAKAAVHFGKDKADCKECREAQEEKKLKEEELARRVKAALQAEAKKKSEAEETKKGKKKKAKKLKREQRKKELEPSKPSPIQLPPSDS